MHLNFSKPFILYINTLRKEVEVVFHQEKDNKRKRLIAKVSTLTVF